MAVYNTRCAECTNVNHPHDYEKSQRCAGFYWDVSRAFTADVETTVTLSMPAAALGTLEGLFFENVETIYVDE